MEAFFANLNHTREVVGGLRVLLERDNKEWEEKITQVLRVEILNYCKTRSPLLSLPFFEYPDSPPAVTTSWTTVLFNKYIPNVSPDENKDEFGYRMVNRETRFGIHYDWHIDRLLLVEGQQELVLWMTKLIRVIVGRIENHVVDAFLKPSLWNQATYCLYHRDQADLMRKMTEGVDIQPILIDDDAVDVTNAHTLRLIKREQPKIVIHLGEGKAVLYRRDVVRDNTPEENKSRYLHYSMMFAATLASPVPVDGAQELKDFRETAARLLSLIHEAKFVQSALRERAFIDVEKGIKEMENAFLYTR